MVARRFSRTDGKEFARPRGGALAADGPGRLRGYDQRNRGSGPSL